jgi:hypothetical protein
MKTIEQQNAIIAEFMGYNVIEKPPIKDGVIVWSKAIDDSFPDKTLILSNIKYHTSWDWLMLVVERIESLGFIFKMYGNEVTFLKKGTFNTRIWNDDFIGDTKIKAVYNAVIEFIEWYNANK